MRVHCLSSQLKDTSEDNGRGKEFKGVEDLCHKWGLRCAKECRLLPGESCIVELHGCAKEWVGKQVKG